LAVPENIFIFADVTIFETMTTSKQHPMRRFAILLAMALSTATSMTAQTTPQQTDKRMFNHLDFGVTVGTTGLGFDVAMPVGDYVRLRTGFSFVPRIEVPMSFGIQVGDDPSTSASKFQRLSSMLESFTGHPVEDHVDMIGKPTMWNWNVLVDVYPLKNNKHWRVTAGFFLGNSNVAEAFNKTESMTSLLAVGIYNNLYNKFDGKSREEVLDIKLIDLGEGYEHIYTDPQLLFTLQKKLAGTGRMGMHVGNYTHDIVDAEGNVIHKKGDPYMMEPDEDHMVKATMKVNAFKPYLGVGYDGRLVKGNDRLHISVDAGLMLWGGKPSLYTHDGTDLINDVEDISGKVGRYVDFMAKIKVFPVASVRFAYTIF
jgi:hypothetical protein